MGVLYSVLPLDQRCAEWLDQEGVSHPGPAADTRFPTPKEIQSALQQMADYTVDLSADSAPGEWLATITDAKSTTGAWASLRVRHYSSDDEPHEFYFPKGWPEVIFTVVERLTHDCGPLVVVDDSFVKPIIVRSNDSVQELLRNYDTT
jgi:hypothetical protein